MTIDSDILYLLGFMTSDEKTIFETGQRIYDEMERAFTSTRLGLFNKSVRDDACRFWQTKTISNRGVLDYINIKIEKFASKGKFKYINYKIMNKAIEADELTGEKKEVLKYHYMEVMDLHKLLFEAIRGESIL